MHATPKMSSLLFAYTVTFRRYKFAVLSTLLLIAVAICAFIAIVISVRFMLRAHAGAAVSVLVIVVLGCGYAVWAFMEPVGDDEAARGIGRGSGC